MAKSLEERVFELWASLTRQVQTSKKPEAGLGIAQREMLVQLADEYLKEGEDATVRAGRATLDPLNPVMVGDAISLLDLMKKRWE